VKSGVIPVSDIETLVGGSGNIAVDELTLRLAGMSFPLIQCYSRALATSSYGDFTVGSAFDVQGQDDRCALDQGLPFYFFWDKTNHGCVMLREPMYQYTTTALQGRPNFVIMDDVLLFDDPPFRRDAWTPCENSLAAKIPYFFMKLIQTQEKNLPRVLEELNKSKKAVTQALLRAFSRASAGSSDGQRLDELLWLVWKCDCVDSLDEDIRRAIFAIVAEYVSDMGEAHEMELLQALQLSFEESDGLPDVSDGRD
jgi:hypothetical protein